VTDRIEFLSLEQLVGRVRRELPKSCNVLVRLDEMPHFHESHGGHWLQRITGVTSSETAYIAVHRDPTAAPLGLNYSATLPELLAIYDDPELRPTLRTGELALVQANPGIGAESRLYLNVPAILIVRPFVAFGRREVDFGTRCARRTFLYLAKGVGRRHDRDEDSGPRAASVAGQILHDVVSIWAEHPRKRQRPIEELFDSELPPERITQLVLLGLQANGVIRQALTRARTNLQAAVESKAVQALLDSDHWVAESEHLNNGVTVSPDLLGQTQVVEIKAKNPNSPYADVDKDLRQLDSYLAWCMVQFGVDYVRDNFTGVLLQLHRDTPEDQRIIPRPPDLGSLGRRILNRQRLLGLAAGGWLPAPKHEDQECARCPHSRDDLNPATGRPLPAACTYYCQQERSWDCVVEHDGTVTTCPLFERCDQYDEYAAYERGDRFNRLRQVLLAEEEEVECLNQSIAMMVDDELELGYLIRGFRIAKTTTGRVTLEAPEGLSLLRFAVPGDSFTLLQGGRIVSIAHYDRRRRGEHRFRLTNSARLTTGESVDLRVLPGGLFPVRLQLAELDRIQRSGMDPIWVRPERTNPTDTEVVDYDELDGLLDSTADLILLDAAGSTRQFELLEETLGKCDGRSLVVVPEGATWKPPSSVSDLSTNALCDQYDATPGACAVRLEAIALKARDATAWVIERERTYVDSLRAVLGVGEDSFRQVIILGAESYPLLALSNVLDVASRLILIGDLGAAGPRAQSRQARTSHFWSNGIRFLWEAGTFAMPSRIRQIGRHRAPRPKIRAYLDSLISDEGPLTFDAVRVESVDGLGIDRSTSVKLEAEVTPTTSASHRFVIEADVLDDIDHREFRAMLRAIGAPAVEAMSTVRQGQLDRTLMGCRLRIRRVDPSAQMQSRKSPHLIRLTLASAGSGHPYRHNALNREEAARIVVFAKENSLTPMAAVAPFPAMALEIARLAEAEEVSNLDVWTLEAFANHAQHRERVVLFPFTLGKPGPTYPPPLNDITNLAPLFVSEAKELRIFASPEAIQHHPLLRRLAKATGAS
jgi:hypothetical protein